MPSQNSSLAPARNSAPPRRSLRALTAQPGFRIKLKPRRDALTRVRHDLRSLLQAVVGYSDLLAEPRYGALSAEQARFVGHVREAATHLQEMVDTCIELSRPDNDVARILEAPQVLVGQLLTRLRYALCCELFASDLAERTIRLDASTLERALLGIAAVLSREGTMPLSLRASVCGERLVLNLSVASSLLGEGTLLSLDSLEDDLGNRDFVRLKLAEVLLSRMGFESRFTTDLHSAELTLPL